MPNHDSNISEELIADPMSLQTYNVSLNSAKLHPKKNVLCGGIVFRKTVIRNVGFPDICFP